MHLGEDAAVGVVGVFAGEEGAAGAGGDADGPAAAVDRPATGGLIQVADEQDAALGRGREFRERGDRFDHRERFDRERGRSEYHGRDFRRGFRH